MQLKSFINKLNLCKNSEAVSGQSHYFFYSYKNKASLYRLLVI